MKTLMRTLLKLFRSLFRKTPVRIVIDTNLLVAYMFKKNQPSSWVMAQVKEKGITLELRSIDPKHNLHGQKIELAWR